MVSSLQIFNFFNFIIDFKDSNEVEGKASPYKSFNTQRIDNETLSRNNIFTVQKWLNDDPKIIEYYGE